MSILKNISYWAKSNPKKARAIILISHFLIALNAILLGMLFYVMDFGELNWLVWMTAIFTLLIYALYPRNQSREQYVDTYTRRKILDFCFVLCTAFAISFGVCNYLLIMSQHLMSVQVHL